MLKRRQVLEDRAMRVKITKITQSPTTLNGNAIDHACDGETIYLDFFLKNWLNVTQNSDESKKRGRPLTCSEPEQVHNDIM